MYANLNQNGMGRVLAPGSEIIKDSALSESEIFALRDKFKVQYARDKGWDPNNLNESQLMEIHADKRWQSPGLLFS